MKKSSILSLGIIATMGFALQSCSETLTVDSSALKNEEYVQSFIRSFGIPDAGHTYSMAKSASVTVTTNHPTDVFVSANIDGTNYCFAQYPGLDGKATMKFDVPRDLKYVNVVTDQGITVVPVGGSANLAPVKSRAEITPETSFTLPLTSSNIDFTTYPLDLNISGLLRPRDITEGGWPDISYTYLSDEDKMSGAEYAQYINPNITNDVTATDRRYIWNGTNENITIDNLKRMKIDGVYQDFEVGRIYGNNQSLASSTEFTLVPLAQVLETPRLGTFPIIKEYAPSATADLNKWTHTVVLDYDNRKISIEGADVNDCTWFKYILDDATLKAKLHDAALHPLPIPEDWFYTTPEGDRHDLPVYPTDESDEAGKLAYYNAWDAFIQDWLDDHTGERPYHDELMPVKALMGIYQVSTASGALPNVTKNSESDKYEIKFYTSRWGYGTTVNSLNENGVVPTIVSTNIYEGPSTPQIRFVSEENNDPHTGSEYAIYMRPKGDTDPAHIVTTLDGRLKSVRRHLPGADPTLYGASTVEQELLFLDYDGDGDYTDFVFRVGGQDPRPGGSFSWMLACEDLGSVGDWDFNDLVVGFGAYSYGQTAQKISIDPLAAGGIYPLYLMWNDFTTNEVYIVGQEIHKWLGRTQLQPYNTSGTFVKPAGNLSVDFDYNVTDHGGIRFSFDKSEYIGGGAMQGFWVLVDPNNVLASHEEELITGGLTKGLNMIDETKLDEIIAANGLYKVTNDGTSEAPIAKMIFVDSRWEWPQETYDIRKAYPLFKDWVGNQETIWYPIENNANVVKR